MVRASSATRTAAPAEPARIDVPAIGVSAEVVRLGLTPKRRLQVPRDYAQAGWWMGGARPGERGPAVIAGHVDSRRGPAVFYRLRELRRGDEVWIRRRHGGRVRFVVERLERHPKDSFPTRRVYGRTRRPALRLITCGGEFDRDRRRYTENVIAYAVAT